MNFSNIIFTQEELKNIVSSLKMSIDIDVKNDVEDNSYATSLTEIVSKIEENMIEKREVTQESLEAWAAMVVSQVEADPNKPSEFSISFQFGRKYIRVVKYWGQQSVYCFIEIATGDIFKAAGWAAPAKGIRGSIYDTNAKYNWNGACFYR